MSTALAIFRGAMRLEYRNQNIKLLRASSGEVTRSSYRGLWVDPEALELLRTEPHPICHTVFVDPLGVEGLPVRSLIVERHELDEVSGNLHLTFRIDNFLQTALDFDTRISTWGREGPRPPERFVTVWRNDWPRVEEVPDADATDAWRGAVDFLTSRWDFSRTVFFRMG